MVVFLNFETHLQDQIKAAVAQKYQLKGNGPQI